MKEEESRCWLAGRNVFIRLPFLLRVVVIYILVSKPPDWPSDPMEGQRVERLVFCSHSYHLV